MSRTRHPALRATILGVGIMLILITPVAALAPGPAGIFTFAGGLGLVLQNSLWARRNFARAKRRFPRTGRLADRAMRRSSDKRRRARDAGRA
ncbi:MAG: hypothetical protein V4537_08845 [Pseudomonadota bacterium]